MSTLALKDALHRLVIDTEDDMLLQQVQLFFLSLKEKRETKDWWLTINEKEKALINKGLEDAKHGRRVSHEVARQEINQLLGRV
jgi:hypothetical protein